LGLLERSLLPCGSRTGERTFLGATLTGAGELTAVPSFKDEGALRPTGDAATAALPTRGRAGEGAVFEADLETVLDEVVRLTPGRGSAGVLAMLDVVAVGVFVPASTVGLAFFYIKAQ